MVWADWKLVAVQPARSKNNNLSNALHDHKT